MADEVKLIDADKLIGYLHERYFWDDDDRDMVFKAIEEQPTIEVEYNAVDGGYYIGQRRNGITYKYLYEIKEPEIIGNVNEVTL